MDLIFPDWMGCAPAGIGACSTVRRGGVSRAPYDDNYGGGGLNLGTHVGDRWEDVLENRHLLRAALPAEPVWLSQVHGVTVLDAADAQLNVKADAAYTTRPGVVCAIMTADCLPVLLCDAAGKVVAAAHAGWRGLAHGVLEKTLAAMRRAGAGEIIAWLGPAIGPRHFEVGADVVAAFSGGNLDWSKDVASAFSRRTGVPGKYDADIYLLARTILRRAGVNHVSGGRFCTVSDASRFYSYRRDGVTGRMGSFIWIK